MSERLYWYWLSNIEGIGSISTKKLMDIYQKPSNLFREKGEHLQKLGILKQPAVEQLLKSKADFNRLEDSYRRLMARGIKLITIDDKEYPKRLRELYDKPYSLYLKGALPVEHVPTVAIIGARNASFHGLELAEYFGKELARAGLQIISGMAYGIDGAGQSGALKANGYSLAILGCGVDICYPKEHYNLYQALIEQGGVLSEFALGWPPRAQHFPMRNRLISGMADCVIVIEARERSGSFITVDLALEQGKEIFVLPGRITDECSKGCNSLIAAGANVLCSPADILDFFGYDGKNNVIFHKNKMLILAQGEKLLYSCLNLEPKHVEIIAKEANLDLSEVMNMLLDFESRNLVKRIGNNYFASKIFK